MNSVVRIALALVLAAALAPSASLAQTQSGAATMVVFNPTSDDGSLSEDLQLEVKQWILEYLNHHYSRLIRLFGDQEIRQTISNMEQDVCKAEFTGECVKKVSKMLDADLAVYGSLQHKQDYVFRVSAERQGELFYTQVITETAKPELRAKVEQFVQELCKRLEQSPVLFQTIPPGATVIIDGKEEGVTPLEKVLRPGDYTVVYLKDDHMQLERKYRFDRGKYQELKEKLQPFLTILSVSVVDAGTEARLTGARVFVDGQDRGEASPTFYADDVAPGQHQVKVVKPGYESATFAFMATAAAPQRATARMRPILGIATVTDPTATASAADGSAAAAGNTGGTWGKPPQCVQIVSDLMNSDERRRAFRRAWEAAKVQCETCAETQAKEAAYREEVTRYKAIDAKNRILNCVEMKKRK